MKDTRQDLINKALCEIIPAEAWMVESLRLAGYDADSYGDDVHVNLASQNFRDADKLQRLISENVEVDDE